MRSRNISACTIIQNMAQIKEIYETSGETIPGNSDTILYLGGNEAETHKYVSAALGKASILTKTHGQTHGSRGSYSTNTQITGRELLAPDEVRLLDNRFATMGGAAPYEHKQRLYYGRPFALAEAIPQGLPEAPPEAKPDTPHTRENIGEAHEKENE